MQVAVDGGRVAHVNLHRVTKVAEFFVDEIHQLMHRLRLAITGHHQTFAGVRLQIFQTFIEPFFISRHRHVALHRNTQCLGEITGSIGHRAGVHALAVVGVSAGLAHQRLGHIKAVHAAFVFGQLAAARKVAHMAA